jgi:hypothetical protein
MVGSQDAQPVGEYLPMLSFSFCRFPLSCKCNRDRMARRQSVGVVRAHRAREFYGQDLPEFSFCSREFALPEEGTADLVPVRKDQVMIGTQEFQPGRQQQPVFGLGFGVTAGLEQEEGELMPCGQRVGVAGSEDSLLRGQDLPELGLCLRKSGLVQEYGGQLMPSREGLRVIRTQEPRPDGEDIAELGFGLGKLVLMQESGG